MTTTASAAATLSPADAPRQATGWAALAFVAIVVVQNLIRGAVAPQNNASMSDVVDYYVHHRPLEVLLSVTFVASGCALAIVLGGLLHLASAGPDRAWAYTGFAGGVGIFVLFSTMIGVDAALVGVARGAQPDGAVNALWALHNAIFAVLDLSIAVALFGLGRVAVARGLAPRPFSWLAPAGAGLLAIGAFGAPLLADGSVMPMMYVAVVGFLVWLAFLVAVGVRSLTGAGVG
jgi:hypothetical protein